MNFNFKIPKINIFKLQKENTPEVAEKKKRNKRILLYIPVIALGFVVGYVYFSDYSKPYKPESTNTTQSVNPFEDNTVKQVRSQPEQKTQEPVNMQNVQNTQNVQNNLVSTGTDLQKSQSVQSSQGQIQSQNVAVASRSIYIPARDIFTGSTTMKQELESQIALIKAKVELKKLENELKKTEEDEKLIPLMTKSQLSKITAEIAEKKVEPVKMPLIVPDLVGVYNFNGQKIGVFSLGGIQTRAAQGSKIGEFEVQEISTNKAVLIGPDKKTYTVYLKMPDRYPVSNGMFSKGQSAPRVIQPLSQPPQPNEVQPTIVPIPQNPIPFPYNVR